MMETKSPTQTNNDSRLLSNMPHLVALPTTPRPVQCTFCGAERYTEGFSIGARIFWLPTGAKPCTCPLGQSEYQRKQDEVATKYATEKKAEEDKEMRRRVERITGESGMGERFLQRTFDTYSTNTITNKKIYSVCLKYAQNFDKQRPRHGEPLPERNGFIISGEKGTGKTHIAAAIANFLLNQGTSVIFMTERNLFGKIRDAYSKSRNYGNDGQTESEIRSIYETVPLLVIDDLGKEKATEWTLATLYAIIDGRYDRAMPTIITTNYDTKNLVKRITPKEGDFELNLVTAEAIVDRLIEMSESIAVMGKSWRGL